MVELRSNCADCVGLCCVALSFKESGFFAITKPAGRPCPNLLADHRCGIHDSLREKGFKGCTVYDCFGAGQRVVHEKFGGQDWRSAPDMLGTFQVMRKLHELLWHLTEVVARVPAMRDEAERAIETTEDLADNVTADLDVSAHQELVGELLFRASATIRGGADQEYRGALLLGRDLSGRDFRRAGLRGAFLTGANLTGADLGLADLLGAEMLNTNLSGADLSTSLFLTQYQVNGAIGDAVTRLPDTLTRPGHYR
ncbi:pentapeptide repeat-containing protein [Actinophytocola sp. NPDC049390]|uniref:pentapeptide repeat-containing protein n=1 Tax=Actinophytocola sp. NPDC049390 TaxID=3363894 RepID=UPI0037B631B3